MDATASRFLEHEARALLGRLNMVQPFVTSQVMVPSANVSRAALLAIENHLARGRNRLRHLLKGFIASLRSGEWHGLPAHEAQRRFTLVRLRFGATLAQFDLFDDVLAQRGQRETGMWLAGLDVAAADAIALPGFLDPPEVICYLDRGIGAAIRRARTRLPGGGANPVAVIRMPRERMVGSGIASSLVHEVGHQAAALLGLVDSLRPVLRARAHDVDGEANEWTCWDRWISEIVADFWSVAHIGIGSTIGLMGVVSVPSAFVFRVTLADPHPFPWIRVKLSCAMGAALYPHPQWDALWQLWSELYPVAAVPPGQRGLVERLARHATEFVDLLVSHRPPSLRGRTLAQAMPTAPRTPRQLQALFKPGGAGASGLASLPPCLALAAIGQARADGRLRPEHDGGITRQLLYRWALHRSLNETAACAALTAAGHHGARDPVPTALGAMA
jgi:hypothetical protein